MHVQPVKLVDELGQVSLHILFFVGCEVDSGRRVFVLQSLILFLSD